MAKTVSSGAATKTLQLRLKDKHSGFLRQQACAVNFAWNFVNELSVKHFDRKRAFLSAYDRQPYTKGAGAALGLHSQAIQAGQAALARIQPQVAPALAGLGVLKSQCAALQGLKGVDTGP